MSVCIVIPARLRSTRLSEKALADIHGKPMVQHVYERAKLVRGVDDVIVATDHEKVQNAVAKFGGKSIMTPETLSSGTDRVAFVAQKNKDLGYSIYINIQGDEPTLDPLAVERSLELVTSKKFTMATSAAPLLNNESLQNKNVVKVLIDKNGKAVYFSRFPIPYSRIEFSQKLNDIEQPRHHLGVYVYTTETLIKFSTLPKCVWESAESLEQLRALYYGIPIGVAMADRASTGVDTLDDLEAVRNLLKK